MHEVAGRVARSLSELDEVRDGVRKWAVVIAAALLFLPLAVDWVPPGEEARVAVGGIDHLIITNFTVPFKK